MVLVLIFLLHTVKGHQFTCQAVGYYPHPSDCSQFYRCTDLFQSGNYQEHLFTCAQGTVWDSNIGICNAKEAVAACTMSSSEGVLSPITPPQLAPVPQDLTQTTSAPQILHSTAVDDIMPLWDVDLVTESITTP